MIERNIEQEIKALEKALANPFCSYCNRYIRIDVTGLIKITYCPTCGNELSKMIECGICGNLIQSAALFCTGCGVKRMNLTD